MSGFTQTGVGDLTVSGACLRGTRRRLPLSQLSINTPYQTFMTASFSAALDTGHPDRFSDTHLRTLQRRVQQWRGIMAKKLVYTTAGEPMPELPAMSELALVEGSPSAKVSVTFLNEETGTGIYA